jgi:transposase
MHNLYVGIDIGSASHEACLISADKQFTCSEQVQQSLRDIGRFIQYLQVLQKAQAYSEVIVGMEGSNGYGAPLDRMLIQAGFKVVAINSTAMDKYRKLIGSARKDDVYDAKLVAHYLIDLCAQSIGRGVQEVKDPSESSMGNLRVFTREYRTTKRDLTRVVNRLRKHVLSYFPDFLEVFNDLQTKTAIALLKHYASVSKVKRSRVTTIANRQITERRRVGPKAATKLKKLVSGLTYHDPLEEEMAAVTVDLVSHVEFLIRRAGDLGLKIKAMIANDTSVQAVLKNVKGAGELSTAELLAEIGDKKRFANRDKLSLYCGVACLNYSSGKKVSTRKVTHMNHRAKGVLCMMANAARLHDEESRIYYEKKRAEGKGHWHAVKCLAKYLLRKIYRILQEQALKEEELQMAA